MMKDLGGTGTPRGMTLLEVLVVVGLLSVLLIGTLTIYSQCFTAIRTRDNLITMLADADRIMTSLGEDIRHTIAFLPDYQGSADQIVVAAMKVKQKTPDQPTERIIVYALDARNPNRLIRSVMIGDRSTSLELATLVQKLEIAQKTARVFDVQLVLTHTIAGKVKTWRVSSAFALR